MPPSPPGGIGSVLVRLSQPRPAKTSAPQSGPAACPAPCTPRPFRRHRVSPRCGSAKSFGQSVNWSPSSGDILGCAKNLVNAESLLRWRHYRSAPLERLFLPDSPPPASTPCLASAKGLYSTAKNEFPV